jgi:drug/metabolite transporter (DMT)-like permease
MKNQKLAYFYIEVVIFLWSTVASAFKIALRYLSVLQLLFLSSLTSLAILFIILLTEGKFRFLLKCSKKGFLHSFLASLLNPFLYYTVLFAAYDMLPAQVAQPLNYTWPIMLVVLSAVFLGQKIPLRGFIAIFVSFAGVVIIASNGSFSAFHSLNTVGVFLALFSAVIWGSFWIINMKDKRDEVVKLCLNFLFGTAFIFLVVLMKGGLSCIDVRGIFPAVYVGLFEMGITYLLFLKSLSLSENTAKISKLIYLAPFLSLLFIHIIVKEKILFSTFVGLSFIVAGIFIESFQKTGNT